jgi:nucleoside-diphosphate-sugar epimerase
MKIKKLEGCTAAIAGGAGLIGSFLADELVDAGASVVVIDDFSKGMRENIAALQGRIEVREGDLEDPGFALEALAGADVVFHLASRSYGVGYAKGHHLEVLQHNERITNNLLAAVEKHRPDRLLVTSSSCVYDDHGHDTLPELPLFQGSPEMANFGYGWAKRFLEQKALIYARETGVALTIVRPFNIYGERYNWVGEHSQAIPMLVKKVMDGDDPVVIWGSGNQRRTYMHALDCARVMCGLVAIDDDCGPVNIGVEQTVTMADLVARICAAVGRNPRLIRDETKPEGRFIKSADASRLRRLLPDFTPSIDLDMGLKRMTGWYDATFGA